MKYCLLLLLFFSLPNITAQTKFDATSYNVTIDDLKTNTYEHDSTANALVIFEEGNSYFQKPKDNIITEIKKKIKILNKKGNSKATVEIFLYNDDSKKNIESISNIVATTYNLINDKIFTTALDENEIYTEIYDNNHTLVTFSLPDVQEGSVITYNYTLESPFIDKYKTWDFQDDIPKLYSEYRTSIPYYYEYNIQLIGYQDLEIQEEKTKAPCPDTKGKVGYSSCFISKYAMKNIAPFIEEKFMTTKYNYLSQIDYDLSAISAIDGTVDRIIKTWKETDKALKINPNIGKQLLKRSLGKDLLPPDIKNITPTKERAKAIYQFIQNEFTWNEEFNILNGVSVKNLIKNKSGNVSEINILLNNLLKRNGISTKPVLLSTRKNGFVTKLYPNVYDFNYLIVQVTIDDEVFLLDATDDYLSFGELPFRCLNHSGRLLDFKNGSEWIEIIPKTNSSILYNVELSINPDTELLGGKIKSRYTGYHSRSKKRNYFSGPEKYELDFENEFHDFRISELNIDCKTKTEEQFNESFNLEFHELNIRGDKIYLDPFLIKFYTDNPFQLLERTYPVDFGYKDNYFYSFQIDLGTRYEVVKLPEDVSMTLPGASGDIVFNSKVLNNKLIVFLNIRFKKEIYSPENYPALKQFMNTIVELQTKTLIVLKKK
mgnify:CR=1 FL=1